VSFNPGDLTYTSRSIDVTDRSMNENCFTFKPDGLKMFVLGEWDDGSWPPQVTVYNLSTPFDVSTAVYDSGEFVLLTGDGYSARGIAISPDGLTMYKTDYVSNYIQEWALSVAWDISTATYTQQFDLSGLLANTYGLHVSPDGKQIFIIDRNAGLIHRYSTTNAWSLTGMAFDTGQTYDFNDVTATYNRCYNPNDIWIDSTGTYMYIVSDGQDVISLHVLSTPWDLTTATYGDTADEYFITQSQDFHPYSLDIGLSNGSLLMLGKGNHDVFEYSFPYSPPPPSHNPVPFETTAIFEVGSIAGIAPIGKFTSTSVFSNGNAVTVEFWSPPEQGIQLIRKSIGDSSIFLLNQPIKDAYYQFIAFQLGVFLDAVQIILNEVKGIREGKTSDNVSILRNALVRGDIAFDTQMLLNNLPEDIQGTQSLLQLIAEGVVSNEIIKNTLSDDEIIAIQAVLNTLDTVDYASSYLFIKHSLQELGTLFYSFQTNIYLDNIQINRLIGANTVEMSFTQNSIHNQITISSISQELFDLADPDINPGTPRIEVHVGGRVLFFLVETRTGSGENFSFWGRDQTARDSSPWALSNSVYLSDPQLASEVVESIPVYSAVDWDPDLYDWILPETFEAIGTPSEILSSIAQEIGGIVRAQDDGSFLIRKKYTVRPINMSSATEDITYNANQVVDFGHSIITGDHYNKVNVNSINADSLLPTIEIEELEEGSARTVGTTSFVKVYWVDSSPEVEGTYVTDGTISKVTGPFVNGSFQEEFTEIVEFNDGIGDTTYPIFDLDLANVEWIGDPGVIVDWNSYGKTLTLENLDAWRLAKVTYTVEYQRYELSGHSVEELLAVFYYTDFANLSITVITPPIALDENGELIDKFGDSISTNNLREDSSAAVERGKAWIDDNKYDVFEHSFKSPYNDLSLDGNIAWIDCSRIGSSGNYYIADVGITISGGRVENTLKVIQWRV